MTRSRSRFRNKLCWMREHLRQLAAYGPYPIVAKKNLDSGAIDTLYKAVRAVNVAKRERENLNDDE